MCTEHEQYYAIEEAHAKQLDFSQKLGLAMEEFRRDPTNPELEENLAFAFFQAGKYSESIKLYEKLISSGLRSLSTLSGLTNSIMPIEEDLHELKLAMRSLMADMDKSDPLQKLARAEKSKTDSAKSKAIREVVDRELLIRNKLDALVVSVGKCVEKYNNDNSPQLASILEIERISKRMLISQEVIVEKVLPAYYRDIVAKLKTKKQLEQQIVECEKPLVADRRIHHEVKKLCLESLERLRREEDIP